MSYTSAIAIQAGVFTLGAVTIHALRDRAEVVTECLTAIATGLAMLALLALTAIQAEYNPPPVDDPAIFGGE